MLFTIACAFFFALVSIVFTQEECISQCPKDCDNKPYQPVCGRSQDGILKSFDNDCALNLYNCQEKGGYEKIYNTSCEDKGCNMFCTYDYTPVCGQNATTTITFPNECILNRDNCLYGYGYKKISDGQCDDGTCYEDYYQPLCAYAPGLPQKTFQQPCELELHNRNNAGKCDAYNYTKSRDGECELPGLCAECVSSYRPSCACNGKVCRTFNDNCDLINVNQCSGTEETRSFPFMKIFDGTCDGTGCPENCYGAFLSLPVCGYNTSHYRRFDFECLLVDYNCKKPKGECFYQQVPCNDTIQ